MAQKHQSCDVPRTPLRQLLSARNRERRLNRTAILGGEVLEPRAMLDGYGSLEGSARDIGVGANGAAWVIGTNRVDANGYEIYRRTNNSWAKVQGAASRIDVDQNGNAWIVNDFGNIYRWNGAGWDALPGSVRDIGVGANGAAWVIGTNRVDANGYEIYRRTNNSWAKVQGAASRIDVDQNGNAWIVNDFGNIYRWNGAGWTLLPGAARDIGVGPDGTCWVVGVNAVPGGYGCWRWTGAGWAGTTSAATQISVGPSGHPWVVNALGSIFFGPGVAGDPVVFSDSNSSPIATPPGALSIPISLGNTISNSGPITGTGSFVTINGGGAVDQSGAVNVNALAIGILGSSTPGLGLTDDGAFSSTLNLTGNASITAPAGVVVEGILGLSAGNSVSPNTPVSVMSKGLIRGSGTIAGRLEVAGTLSPAGNASGSQPYGKLSVGQLILTAGSRLQMQISSDNPGLAYDQIVLLESGSIDGATLEIEALAIGNEPVMVLVDNRGANGISGAFRSPSGQMLSEGASLSPNFAGSGRAGLISYQGGDGNDVTVSIANMAPTDLFLSRSSVSEGVPSGSIVGLLSAVDSDSDEAFSYELVSGTASIAGDWFEIVGTELRVKDASIDFEVEPTPTIKVRATDRFGLYIEKAFTITITDVVEDWSLEQGPGETIVDPGARSGSSRLVKSGIGTLILDQANTHSGGTVVEAGELVIRNPAALGTGTLQVAPGAKVTLDVDTRQVPVSRLELSSTGMLDLANGSVLLAPGNYDLAAIRGFITGARETGSWSGPGITSSSIQPGSFREVGYQLLPDGSLKVGYSAVGDANMDGTVSVQDLIALNAGGKYGTAATDAGWWQGDFNYDGRVNVTDLISLVSSGLYGAGSYMPVSSSGTAVSQSLETPELAAAIPSVTLAGYAAPVSQPEPVLAATSSATARAPEPRRIDEFTWAAIANQSETEKPADLKVARWRMVGR